MIEDAYKQELEAARNPRYVGGAEGSTSMQEWRRLSADAFAARSIETNIVHEEKRGYESEVARVIFEQFPHLKERASNLLTVADRIRAEGRASTRPASHQILGGPIGGFGGVEPAPLPPPDGWFWWAQTQPT